MNVDLARIQFAFTSINLFAGHRTLQVSLYAPALRARGWKASPEKGVICLHPVTHIVIVILQRHPRTWRCWQAGDGAILALLLAPVCGHPPGVRLSFRARRGGLREPRPCRR